MPRHSTTRMAQQHDALLHHTTLKGTAWHNSRLHGTRQTTTKITRNDNGNDDKTNQHTIQQSTWTSVLYSDGGQVAARHKWHGMAQMAQQHDALRHHTALRHGTQDCISGTTNNRMINKQWTIWSRNPWKASGWLMLQVWWHNFHIINAIIKIR